VAGDEERWIQVDLRDGRALEAVAAGPPGAMPLVFHNGTPSDAVAPPFLVDAASSHGLSFLSISRPGYAGSQTQHGRRVAGAARDVAAVLDAIGAGSFVTAGWSGGGPHALACAALLPDRCRAAATIAGVAPFAAAGIEWTAGMAAENVEEFGKASAGEAALSQFLRQALPALSGVQPGQVIESLGGLVSEVDKVALTGERAGYLAALFRRAMSAGIAGWRDDDLAFVRDWGFSLNRVTVPVAVWRGDEDRMVPFDHGRWLAGHLPRARAHLLAGQGHLSLFFDYGAEVVADLAALAAAR
jgi:pimeloyl-ACP methyl ester carboxylesterase